MPRPIQPRLTDECPMDYEDRADCSPAPDDTWGLGDDLISDLEELDQ